MKKSLKKARERVHLFTATTADELWSQPIEKIRHRQGTIEQPSRDGLTLELLHTCLVLENPLQRWVVNRVPAMNPAFALAEVVWILNGRNDSAFLNFWNPKLPKFQGSGDMYHGAYGFRLRRLFGIDQVRKSYETLAQVPHSRQVVLQIWDPRGDLPVENGQPRDQDIPCNLCAMVKVREGKLEWVQVMRSNDLVLGLPHNLVQFTYLQEMFAAWLGCGIGTYTHFSDSLHIYNRDIDALDCVNTDAPQPNTDRWSTGFDETMILIEELADRMDIMRQQGVTEKHLHRACTAPDIPRVAQNLLWIVGADAARRWQMSDLSKTLAKQCSNPSLTQMWNQWLRRQEDRHVRELRRNDE